jgi:hypothetical protein
VRQHETNIRKELAPKNDIRTTNAEDEDEICPATFVGERGS